MPLASHLAHTKLKVAHFGCAQWFFVEEGEVGRRGLREAVGRFWLFFMATQSFLLILSLLPFVKI